MSSRGFQVKKQKIYFAVIIVSLMSEIFITGHIINYEAFFRDKYVIAGKMPSYVYPGLQYSLFVLCILLVLLIIGIFLRGKLPVYSWVIFSAVCLLVSIYSILTAVRSYNFMERYEPEGTIMQGTTLEDLSLIYNSQKSIAIYFKKDDCPACISIEGGLASYFRENNVDYVCYSTTMDKELRPDYLHEQLMKYGIQSVLSIVFLENGKVTEKWEYEDIEKRLYH